jgi:peptidylprolyl isomerase
MIKIINLKTNIFLYRPKLNIFAVTIAELYKPISYYMNSHPRKIFLLLTIILMVSCKAPGGNQNTIVSIKTSMGDIKIKLYDGTPVHRDNFIRLINSSFYDGVSFHRVIKNFMIQAGDPETKSVQVKNISDSLKTYTIPAEFNGSYFHKKGALAAARQSDDVNPSMRSSGTQFYIVQGVKFSDDELNAAEQRINSNMKQSRFNFFIHQTTDSLHLAGKTLTDAEIQDIASVKMFQYLTEYKQYKIPEDQRNIYKTIGGTPRLDGTYTVFGEVTEGLDVVDKIAEVPTDGSDKPLNDVKIIKIKIVKN